MESKAARRMAGVTKELQSIARAEERRREAALKAKPVRWKQELESRLPEKVYTGLESAFGKAFSLVFEKGWFKVPVEEELQKRADEVSKRAYGAVRDLLYEEMGMKMGEAVQH